MCTYAVSNNGMVQNREKNETSKSRICLHESILWKSTDTLQSAREQNDERRVNVSLDVLACWGYLFSIETWNAFETFWWFDKGSNEDRWITAKLVTGPAYWWKKDLLSNNMMHIHMNLYFKVRSFICTCIQVYAWFIRICRERKILFFLLTGS